MRLILAGFVRVAPLLLLAFSAFAERLPIKTYTVADGLLRDHIKRIRQDSRGFLWFCTTEGVSRFDGARMTNFTAADGLPDRSANDFLETKNGGTIYIATDKGLARLNPRAAPDNPLFSAFLPANPKSANILTLFEDKNNQVWVGTSDGLYKLIEAGETVGFEPVTLGESLETGGPIAEPSPNALSVNSIIEDRFGTLWIGTFGGGLFRLSQDGVLRRLTKADGFGDNRITDLLEGRDGRIWMSMRSDELGGVCRLDPAAADKPVRECYRTVDGLPSNWVRNMLQTGDGQMWLATARGLCRWRGDENAPVCQNYTAKNDLCDDVFVLTEDREGNLWAGSSCGAQKISRYGFTTYDEADGLDSQPVNSIFENSKGELFVSANLQASVVSRFDGHKFSLVKPALPDFVDYHGWGWQQTVWQDGRGAWWIPTGYGIFRSPDETDFDDLSRARLENLKTGAKGEEIFRLFEDSRGDVWILTIGIANELLRWERAKNVWHDYTARVGFSMSRVGSAIAEDAHGNIWIGASSDHGDSALIRYRRGEFQILPETALECGTRNAECGIENKKSSTVNQENAEQKTISQPSPTGIQPSAFSLPHSPSGWIRDLFLDSRGRLWIASTKDGVWRLDETNSERFEFVKYTPANGLTSSATASLTEDEFGRIYVGTWRGIDRLNPETGQIENFTTADGLPDSFVENAFRDRKNQLWFTTGKGLARFVPEPPRARQAPTILITGLRVEGLPQSISILGETDAGTLDLKSDQQQLSVDFLGLGVSLGEKLRYEYRLNGENWTPTAERTVNFANLASGSYRFEVRAQTSDRIFSQPAVFSFKIAVPLWRRWWFVAGVAALIVFLIYTFYRYRLNKFLEIERTRTRIATDLHDDIGANLSKISLLSEIVKLQMNAGGSAESRRMLTTIAEVSRSSVAAMRDIVWAINPQRDSVLEMTRKMRQHAEETLVPKNIAVKFDAPEDGSGTKLSMDVRRELFLVFKEAINNAARHADCSRVEIVFSASRGGIFLRIADDGQGFVVSESFSGNGLANMEARAAKLGGRFEVESTVGRGTKIEIRI